MDKSDLSKYQENVLKAALSYHDRGWCAIPIRHKEKAAEIPWRARQEERPEREQVEEWFSDGKNHNIGIVCGKVSGNLVVLVFNEKGDYQPFAKQNPVFGLCDVVETYRGYHIYIHLMMTSVTSHIYAGGRFEIKSDGTYVVAPPSLHPEGVHYKWLKKT